MLDLVCFYNQAIVVDRRKHFKVFCRLYFCILDLLFTILVIISLLFSNFVKCIPFLSTF